MPDERDAAIDRAPSDDAEQDASPDPPIGGDEAPCYHLNPAHTGAHSGGVIRPPLHRLWSVDLKGEISYPIVAMGRVFVTVHEGSTAKVVALDQNSGARLWEARGGTPAGPTADCAYDRGKVFMTNWDGEIRALDAMTGQVLWVVQPSPGFTSPPTATNGVLVVYGNNTSMAAYDESNGRQLWQFVPRGSDSPPTVSQGIVFAAGGCQETWAVELSTGKLRWQYPGYCLGGEGDVAAVYGSRVYVRDRVSYGYTVLLDRETGTRIDDWTDQIRVPAFDGSVGFFVTYQQHLVARALLDQQMIWSFEDTPLVSEPIVANGYVYVITSEGQLDAFDEKTGALAWSDAIAFPIGSFGGTNLGPWAGLSVTDHLLLVPGATVLVAYGEPL